MAHVFQASSIDPTFFLLAKAVFGIGVTLMGPLMAYSTYEGFREGISSAWWKKVEVKIVQSQVVVKHEMGRTVYHPSIEYQYVVEKNKYAGKRIALLGTSSKIQSEAEAVTAKYPKGTQQTAYYDPDNPETCVLERGLSWLNYVMILISIICIIVGPLIVWDHVRAIRNRLAKKQQS